MLPTVNGLWLLLLAVTVVKLMSADLTTKVKRASNTTTITEILNVLVHEDNYDKRLRPNYGGKPVEVGITIHISSISAVSEVQMDFTLDFYLRQMWTDNRLNYEGRNLKEDFVVSTEKDLLVKRGDFRWALTTRTNCGCRTRSSRTRRAPSSIWPPRTTPSCASVRRAA